jgi:hypothetical protein
LYAANEIIDQAVDESTAIIAGSPSEINPE